MIPKGNQRAGGRQLATHLMNQYDNERVEIAEIRGAVAPDLHGAFAEWRAQAGATRCRKYLYSLSLNPDHRQGPFSREQYYDFIERTEQKLGLTDQARAIVFHSKYGREHCHVVWSRIDLDKMKAVQLSHDHQNLRTIAQEFARDHGIQLPKGMQKNRGKDRYANRDQWENLTERQQYERTGITKEERQRDIRAAWDQSDNAASLVRALEERGYLLARGDQRGYVVVDRGGDIHSLSRQLKGIKRKEFSERLKDYPPERLPDAAKAQAFIRENLQRGTRKERTGPTPDERRAQLVATQTKRREPLDRLRRDTALRHQQERDALLAAQRVRDADVADERLRNQPKGLLAFLARITGIKAFTDHRNRRQDEDRSREHQKQLEALRRRHDREEHEIKRRYRAQSLVDARERHSLETRLHREGYLQRLVEAQRERADDSDRSDRGGGGGSPPTSVIAPAPALQQPGIKGRLARLFRRKTGQTKIEAKENAADLTKAGKAGPAPQAITSEPHQRAETRQEQAPETGGRSRVELRENADDVTGPPSPSFDDKALAAALRERAERKGKEPRSRTDEPQISASDAFAEALRRRAERKREQRDPDISKGRRGRSRDPDRDR